MSYSGRPKNISPFCETKTHSILYAIFSLLPGPSGAHFCGKRTMERIQQINHPKWPNQMAFFDVSFYWQKFFGVFGQGGVS
jgi:hypothetical protein